MKPALLIFLAAVALPISLCAAEQIDTSDFGALRAKAESGNPVAQYNLGIAYAQGRQTPVNPVEAFVWLSLAAEGGSTGKALDTLLETLSPTQLAAGRRRLEAMRSSNPNLRAAPAATTRPTPTIGASVPIIGAPAASSPPSTPIIAVPSATNETKQLQDQLAASTEARKQLSEELGNAWKEIAQLKNQLASRTGSANELAAAQAIIRESQSALTKQSTELAATRADAAAVRTELANVQSQLNTARQSLAANTASASAASDAAAALERERTAHAATQATLGQLKNQLNDATAARATLERELATRTAAAERSQGTAAEEAKKWTAEKTSLSHQTETFARELKEARADLATLRQNSAAAATKLTDAESRARQVAMLEEKLATTRDELAATKTALTTANSRLQSAESRTQAGAQAESQLTTLRNQIGSLERDLQAATTASKRIATDKAAAESALATATQKLTDATKEMASLREHAAESGRQSSATSEQKISGLQSELNDTKSRLNTAEKLAAARDDELNKLKATAAARIADSRPTSSSTDLEVARRAAADAQQRLASLTQEVTTLRTQAAAARDLEARVRQLEAEKTAPMSRPGDSGVNKDELSRALAAQADAESKLSTALRSYTLLSNERDELRARVADLSSKVSSTTEALNGAQAQVNAASAATSASLLGSAELEALRIRTAAAERSAAAAQAELERANQLLGTVRPAGSQPMRPTAPPGEAARTHTIAVGETLSSIAQRYYGSSSRWPEILAANRDVLPDERSFIAGRTLRIP